MTAILEDIDRRKQFVQVTEGLINESGGQTYLPIGIVEIDRKTRKALIELPTEADSGANRMWVKFDAARNEVADTEAVA